ncbi:MAG: ubiquinol-cytochrome C chaperone [Roseitalea sp.]|nr:ubiquinol-cytochrome C chaperone [Roseitalea sp.]MBO6722824.1 ubiquinol-cytochrome C chaperone [Roseitalea sp.]MBO6743982.1 ubiquinol-cytochrome C chaperone [Roseitalea sp.]
MIVSLFRRKGQNANRIIVDRMFQQVVDAARQPVLYADWGIPDTPLGRYESLGLHMIVLLHRTRDAGEPVEALAQDVLDEFFKDIDHSIRELGVGDVGVPKRMKKLARMFYGRMGPYWEAIDAGDAGALATALGRNIMPDNAASANLKADAIANYMLAAATELAAQSNETLLTGDLAFPDAGAMT